MFYALGEQGESNLWLNLYAEITNISGGRCCVSDTILGRRKRGCGARHWGLHTQVTNVRSSNKEEKLKINDKIRAKDGRGGGAK